MSSGGWLTLLPREWDLLPAKALFSERREPGRPEDPHLTPSQVYGVLPQSEFIERTGGQVVLANSTPASMKRVLPDDFIIHLRSFQGGIERSTISGRVSPAYTVLTPSELAEPRFFRWLLKSSAYIQELRTTTNQLRDGQAIGYRDFARIALPTPTRAKQEQIADYLDRETAQIDRLIAKQEQLVTRLHERRESQIAATLQERAWLERRIKDVASVVNGYPFDAATFMDAGGTPLVRIRDIVSTEYATFVPQEAVPSEAIICDGDIVIGMDGDFNSVLWSRGPAALNQRLCLLRTGTDALASYLAYAVLRPLKLINDLTYSTTVKHLSSKQVANIRIPLPPLDEQRRIVAYLDEETAKIDALIAKAQRFIELAKERRAALITAAVTGQLDVTAA